MSISGFAKSQKNNEMIQPKNIDKMPQRTLELFFETKIKILLIIPEKIIIRNRTKTPTAPSVDPFAAETIKMATKIINNSNCNDERASPVILNQFHFLIVVFKDPDLFIAFDKFLSLFKSKIILINYNV